MAQARPAIDPFGLGRLADTLRQGRLDAQNRQIQEQQAVTRGLQQEILGGQVQQQRQSLADLATARGQQAGLQTALQQDTGQSNTLKAINFLESRNPQQAQELRNKTILTAGEMLKLKVKPTDITKFLKEEAGLDWNIESEDDQTVTLNDGTTFKNINRETGDVLWEIPLSPKPTPLMVSLEAAGIKKGTPEFKAKIRESLVDPKTEDDKDLFKNAAKIRGEIDKASDSFNKVTDAYGRIKAVSANPSPAGDLALIFNFMKMLDPGSVVRESEFRTAEEARAWLSKTEEQGVVVPAFIKQGIQKLSTGQKLLPEQRADFIKQSRSLFEDAKSRNKTTVDNFVALGTRFGLERDDIVVGRGMPEIQQSQPELPDFELERTGVIERNRVPTELPEGSTLIGTKDGKNVFKLPNGKMVVDTGE